VKTREKRRLFSFVPLLPFLSLSFSVPLPLPTVAAQQAPQHTTQAGAAAAGRNNADAGEHSGVTAAAVMAAWFHHGVY